MEYLQAQYAEQIRIASLSALSNDDTIDSAGFLEMCKDEEDKSFDTLEEAQSEVDRLENMWIIRTVEKEYLTKNTDSEESFEENFSTNFSIYNNTYLTNNF